MKKGNGRALQNEQVRKAGEAPMRQGSIRLGLSLLVVLGFWANDLPAQGVLIVPATPYEPAHQPYAPTPLLSRPRPAPSPYPLHRALNNHGLGCGIDPYYVPCGNLHYELNFIFGSCRSFFSEPCPTGSCASKHLWR
jgi:hypothetical protein